MRPAIAFLALAAVCLLWGIASADFYLPNHLVDASAVTTWYLPVHQADGGLGYVFEMAPASGSAVRVIYGVREGVARPAWYPAHTPDASGPGAPGTPSAIVLIVVIVFMFVVLVAAAAGVGAWALSRSGILGGTSAERTAAAVPYPDDDALDIIRRRYARGEITYDEYEALRKNLEM